MAADNPNSLETGTNKETIESVENQALQQEQAGEFLDTQRDKTERTWATKKEMSEKTALTDEIVAPKGIKSENQEAPISDKTQQFVDRFNHAKTHAEAIKIMNDALAAVEKGDIPPDEVNQILDRATDNSDLDKAT